MSHAIRRLFLLLCLGSAFPTADGIFMGKLSSKKRCADEDCVYAISLARAEDDYNAPDCRFINIRKGQLIYVYSKLVKEKKAGEFWFGNVYREEYEDQMGTVGYFPRSLVMEQQVFRKAKTTIPTKVTDFLCE
ncbi:otoraplin [Heteronotia binoei]|uniref:otoraplin n=1 Tax=Heteronotia binoei TaxID=13085 RepID=UPI00292DDCCF|nr:otoraplin [Heteronotia binoei]